MILPVGVDLPFDIFDFILLEKSASVAMLRDVDDIVSNPGPALASGADLRDRRTSCQRLEAFVGGIRTIHGSQIRADGGEGHI